RPPPRSTLFPYTTLFRSEGGFTVFLPNPVSAGQALDFEVMLQGDFMLDADTVEGCIYNCPKNLDCHYPRSNQSWFPRHGFLDRADRKSTRLNSSHDQISY